MYSSWKLGEKIGPVLVKKKITLEILKLMEPLGVDFYPTWKKKGEDLRWTISVVCICNIIACFCLVIAHWILWLLIVQTFFWALMNCKIIFHFSLILKCMSWNHLNVCLEIHSIHFWKLSKSTCKLSFMQITVHGWIVWNDLIVWFCAKLLGCYKYTAS